MKWAIYVPKMTNSQVFYKDLVVFCLEDDKIIGARQYEYDGTSYVISYIGLKYNKNLSTYYGHVKPFETSILLGNTTRTTWIFDTERDAFIQKIWALKKLREQFNYVQKESQMIFDTKVPDKINAIFENLKQETPEYFL